jgi:hypothetical protein
VSGHIEGEAVVLNGPAPPSDPVGLLDQNGILSDMVGGAQSGRAGADDYDGS